MKILMRHGFWTSLMFAIVLQSGCSSKQASNLQEAKLDAQLRMAINRAEQTQVDTVLQCFLKLEGVLDDEKKQLLAEKGITVRNRVNDIIAIEGAPDAIRKLAAQEFVQSISLSLTRYSKEKP